MTINEGEEERSAVEVEVSVAVVETGDSKHKTSQIIDTAGTATNANDRVLVATCDTIPPRVLWQKEHRTFTDKIWGLLYIMSFVAFLSCGLVIVFNSKPRFERDDSTNIRMVSSHYRADVQSCCQDQDGGNDGMYYDLCDQLEASEQRKLRAGESKFDGDEGIFDAFLQSPQIIVGLLSLTAALAISWVVLLRFFAKPIVIATELVKVTVFAYMGAVQEDVGTRVLCFITAFGILAYAVWARQSILFAARIITYSTKAMKANPSMFAGCILVTLFYVLNAYLFVLFFSKSFDVAEVRSETVCYGSGWDEEQCYTHCVFQYPSYVWRMATYLGFAYLWSVLLFTKMRLSLIATIIGSWHFHPDDKPGVFRAITNTITTSVGTLAVSSLISAAAERINRILQEPCWRSYLGPSACITLPIQLFMCLFGQCLSTFIRMLTKFSVIMHVFTGLPFVGSAKKVFKILSRHFKGGFITELTSRGVLSLGAYVFSIGVAMLAWYWLDQEFECETLPGKGGDAMYAIGWLLLGLFNLWYPVLGVYIIILADRFLRTLEGTDEGDKPEHYQHLWVSPLAAIFVGCIAMLFFQYLGGIFLDTIDCLFLCFAVDKDNNVDMTEQEISGLIKSMPEYSEVLEGHAVPIEEEQSEAKEEDLEASFPTK